MRKFLSLVLALVLVASVAVIAVNADSTGVATVTLKNVKGETVTQTYAVGETFTATTYLNASRIGDGKIGSLNAYQTYSSDVLTLADAYDDTGSQYETDPDYNYNYGMVEDIAGMFPVLGDTSTIANAGEIGSIYYNASIANYSGFKFNDDTKILIQTHYTVTAPGTAVIENPIVTLAVANYQLTRIVDRGEIVNNDFTSAVTLSEPTIPIPTGSTVSGTITSYLTKEFPDAVTTVKIDGTDVNYTDSVTGTTEYSFSDVPAGTYTLTVSKLNHVTRTYDVTVSGDTTQDVKICPIGDTDLNGKLASKDAMLAYQHALKKEGATLTGYSFDCADADRNGKVVSKDAMLIYQQVMGKHTLF